MMRLALLTLVATVAAHPQYGPPAEELEQLEQVAAEPHSPSEAEGGAKGDFWWKEEGVFSNTGNHQATVTGGGAFTPQQSPLCGLGSDCVPWHTCIEGYIDTSGSDQLDLRQGGSKPPASLGYKECGALGNVCCKLPSDLVNPHNAGGGGVGVDIVPGGIITGPPYPACSAGLACVEENKCNLFTGFIGARIPLFEGQTFIDYKHCTTEFVVVGVCCQEAPEKLIDGGIGGGYGGSGGVGGGKGDIGGGKGDIGGGIGGGHGNAGGGIGGGHGNAGGGIGGGHGDAGGGIGGGIGGGHGNAGGGIGGGAGGGHGTGGAIGGSGGAVVVGGGAGGGYGGGSSGALITGCSAHEDCVALIQCHNGVINTGGEGLIDLRKKPDYRNCVNHEYPDAQSVCCRLPDAPPVAKACPDYTICTDRDYCDLKGFIVPDSISGAFYGGTDCYTNPVVSLHVGVCCSPAPVSSSITSCPANSVCIPEDFCFGDLLDSGGAFGPYSPGGSWSDCALPDASGHGVCCNNPPPVIAPITEQCGVSHYGTQDDNLKTRIHVPKLDKLEADFGELPWQAIVFFSNYTFKCGATLISNKHLLTVAHCVKGLNPYDIRIRVGEWQVNTFTEPYPYQDLDVSNIFIHPDYTYGSHWNNIAILELKTPVTLEYNVNSVCLHFGAHPIPAGTRCIVSGWGKDSFAGTYQHILKKIDVPLVDHHVCQGLLRKTRLGNYFRLHDSYRCAGGELGKDACVGDGGGPLICYDQSSKSYVAVGLTAWGIGCGEKDVPGAYTDIAKFIPWISEVTGLGGSSDIVVGYGK